MLKSGLSLIVIQRLWQGFAGLITVFIIALTLSQEQQGWYYTFLSLSALYSVFEMGLSSIIIQVTAHMFVKLHWVAKGGAGSATSVFMTFFSRSVRVYMCFALTFFVVSLLVGFGVFSYNSSQSLSVGTWFWPWLLLVTVTAFNMITMPFLAVVEGSGEVAEVYLVRLVQGVLGSLACWAVLLVGGWLWATIMMPLCGVLVIGFWLLKKRISLIQISANWKREDDFDWSKKVWPLQWRVGLNWISVYLMSQLAIPILFYYQNPVVAGQMGLSLTIAHMLGILSQSWITRRVPRMSQAVAKKEWGLLDHLFKKDLLHSSLVFFAGVLILVIAHYCVSKTSYGNRILPFLPFFGLIGFVFFYHINAALSLQLRSFQREPLVWISLLGATLILLGTLLAARLSSADVVVAVMFGVQAFFVFPVSYILWRVWNKKLRYLLNQQVQP